MFDLPGDELILPCAQRPAPYVSYIVVTPVCSFPAPWDCTIGVEARELIALEARYSDGRRVRQRVGIQAVDADGVCYIDNLMWGMDSDEIRELSALVLVIREAM